jgi:hypothetical protein
MSGRSSGSGEHTQKEEGKGWGGACACRNYIVGIALSVPTTATTTTTYRTDTSMRSFLFDRCVLSEIFFVIAVYVWVVGWKLYAQPASDALNRDKGTAGLDCSYSFVLCI